MKIQYNDVYPASSKNIAINPKMMHYPHITAERGLWLVSGYTWGDKDYTPQLLLNEEGEILSGRCQCDSEKPCCPHIAALLVWLAKNEPDKETMDRHRNQVQYLQSRKMAPLPLNPKKPGCPFDLAAALRDYKVYDVDIKAARELEKKYGGKTECSVTIREEFEGQPVLQTDMKDLTMLFLRNELASINCYFHRECDLQMQGLCPTQTHEASLCPLAIVNLWNTEKWLSTHSVDSTNRLGLQLLKHLTPIAAPAEEKKSGGRPITLEPTVIHKKGEFSMGFRIGTGKLYALKNLTELVELAESKGCLPLGKSDSIDFSADDFDEASLPYFSLIRDAVESNRRSSDMVKGGKSRWGYGQAAYLAELKGSLPLFGSLWDSLTENAAGSTLMMKTEQGSGSLTLLDELPEPTLTLRGDRGESRDLYGVVLQGVFPLPVHGGNRDYLLTSPDGKAYFLSPATRQQVARYTPFAEMELFGLNTITVGRDHLAEFYFTTLPALKKGFKIREEDLAGVAELLPDPPEFLIRLDVENQTPVCRLSVSYGEKNYELPDGGVAPWRLSNLEEQAFELVQTYFPVLEPISKKFISMGGEEDLIRLMEEGLPALMNLGEVQATRAFDSQRIKPMPKVSVGVSLSGNLLELSISSEDMTQEEMLALLASYREKKRYHRLKNGTLVKIEEDAGELISMLDSLRITDKEFIRGKMHIPAYRALYLDKMLESCQDLYEHRDRYFRHLIKNFKTVGDSDFETPASLQDILRGYQVFGYKWLKTLSEYGFGGILADDMGLGKTLQMIAVLLSQKEAGVEGTSLVVCPASLVYNWQEEFGRFAPDLKTVPVSGTKSEREKLIAARGEYDVLITSYDSLKRDILLYQEENWLDLVLDEAQFVKTHTTAAFKSVRLLKAAHRFALTGTPIENRLSELWSIFDILMPGFLYPYETFRREIETPIVKSGDEEAKKRLTRMVSPFILRRLKGDVLRDLPDKLEENRVVRFEGEQQKLYDAQVARTLKMISTATGDEVNQKKIQILAELTRLRQLCCDPSLLYENYDGGSAKRAACLDLITSAMEGEHRILLFSQFTSMLELLGKDLDAAGIPWYTITGATPKQERVNLVRRFNEGNVPVFLISLKAGGTGLNLTGADVVIHYDPWWNLAAQNQATDRAHRIGQTKTVCVYKLIAAGSIEEKIQELQNAKQNLAEGILSGELGGIAGMSREDLLELLN